MPTEAPRDEYQRRLQVATMKQPASQAAGAGAGRSSPRTGGAAETATTDTRTPYASGAGASGGCRDDYQRRLASARRKCGTAPSGADDACAQPAAPPADDTPPYPSPCDGGGGNFPESGGYIVLPGDCIATIARERGHHWETLWNDPANADLREARKEPNHLCADDRLYVPPLRPKHELGYSRRRHRFIRRGWPAAR